MIYLYRIEKKYRDLIVKFFPDRDIIDIQTSDDYNAIVLEDDNGIVLFSSDCSEIERKSIKKTIPKVKCFIFFVEYAKTIIENVEDYQRGIDNLFIEETQWIDSLQIPVAKHCNLNCNRCYHFSNLVKGAEYYPMQEYKENMQSLKELQIYIGEIRFLGGEPLLNNQLLDYIEYAHELYPYSIFKIITNGLLLKKLTQSQCEKLLHWNVMISISIYPPMFLSLESIEKHLDRLKVNYEVFRTGNHFEKVLLRRKNENGQRIADKCWKCVIVYNGKIGRCAAGMFIGDFNTYFNMSYPANNVENIADFISSSELIAYLDEAVPLCNWCVGDERVESYPWAKSTNMTSNDYIIEN